MGSGEKSYINGTGHMTKMAAMLIYGKNLQKSSPTELIVMKIMKLGMEQYVLKLYKVDLNIVIELTVTHFQTMSNWTKLVFFLTYSRCRYQVSVGFFLMILSSYVGAKLTKIAVIFLSQAAFLIAIHERIFKPL